MTQKHTLLTLLLATATITSAQSSIASTFGVFEPSPGSSNEVLQLISFLGRTPNVTSSVTFPILLNNTSTDWTWRINITDLPIPDNGDLEDLPAKIEFPENFSRGLRVIDTQWELDWPTAGEGNDTLIDWLGERNMNLTYQALITNKPRNVGEKYTADQNGYCRSILGENCAQSTMNIANTLEVEIDFTTLNGCESTLDVVGEGRSDGVVQSITGSSTYTRGDTLFYRTSQTAMGQDEKMAEFNRSMSALQILILRPEFQASEPRGNSDGAKVLCRIVDNEIVYPSADGSERSAMSGWRVSMEMIWTLVVFALILQ